jgi:hypothetical protein
LSAGLPHYTHTLALLSAENAIDDDRTTVSMADVDKAIHQMVEKPGSLLSIYEAATQSGRPTLYAQVLLACALADKTDLGYFSSTAVKRPLERITGRQYTIPAFAGHLDDFCSDKRANVLEKVGVPRRYRFRFKNPLLQPFVIIHGLAKKLLEPELISANDNDEVGPFGPQ